MFSHAHGSVNHPGANVDEENTSTGAEQQPLPLSAAHLTMLREESGISDEVIRARGYYTLTDVKKLKALGFTSRQLQPPGLVLPLHTTDGAQPFSVFRPDHPLEKDGKTRKYEMIYGQGMRLDCPPLCQPLLADPKIRLFLTEGIKKADALASRGACVVDMQGVSAFKGKNPFGGVTFLADWDYVALNDGREVLIIFDNDVMRKAEVRKALERLTEHLQRKGAHVSAVYLPLDGDKKIGVDDYLAAGHTIEDLEKLLEGPRPQPQAAPPLAELLDDSPLSLRRPLSLIDGRAYAAIWPHVKVTTTETLDKNGAVIKLNPPRVTTEQRLLIVRDDGRIFGEGGDEPLANLGLETKLDTCPPQDRLWTTPAFKAYRAGTRPDPCAVFRSVSSVYDHYLDFSRSLASQADMCDLSACLSFKTWFSDAFDVLPYPWANGDWGSGKTKWGTIWAMTSYLGQVLTLGGSFAALRDLSDYGATLLFDDAETIEDKKTDPEKKALMLAGNRRGAQVPLKELTGDKRWVTRWMNAYCPRGFTAKKPPYGALETRSMLIPLIRTDDSVKGNRDPIRVEGWPVGQRALLDDLWATALTLLPEAKRIWSELDAEVSVVGRSFEVWRAPLAVARLFERHGIVGLEETIRRVMNAATQEKREEPSGNTVKVIQAIACFTFGVSDVSDVSDICGRFNGRYRTERFNSEFTAEEISKKIIELAASDVSDVSSEETAWATAKRIGWIFKTLRLPKKIDNSTKKKSRYRQVTQELVLKLLHSYGVLTIKTSETSETSETSDKSGTSGETSGTSAKGKPNGFHPESADETGFDWSSGAQKPQDDTEMFE